MLNREIRATEVRLTDGGIMPFFDALRLAESQDMDLVLMSPNANPLVCKIMNYEKFIYEQMKKEKEKPKPLEMKEIKVGPNTDENDLDYRIKHMIEFLERGHKVKITMQFRGREMAYVSKGEELILKLIVAVEEYGVAEMMPKLEGKKCSSLFVLSLTNSIYIIKNNSYDCTCKTLYIHIYPNIMKLPLVKLAMMVSI